MVSILSIPHQTMGEAQVRNDSGKALKNKDRSKIVINTKFGHTDQGTSNYSSGYIRESLEGSLRRTSGKLCGLTHHS